jgi:HD-like signal output (HDOD) protein
MENMYKVVGNMPPLPQTVAQVQQACKEDETTIGDIVKIIEHDPMLSANLLKAANSPIYGLAREVKSLSQAVSLFGLSTISGLVMNYGTKRVVKVEPNIYGVTKEQLTKIGLKQALLARVWAGKIDPSVKDELGVVALLSDLGKLAISIALQDKVDLPDFKEAKTFLELRKAEKAVAQATTELASAMMFEHWQFNQNTIDVLNFFAGNTKEVAPKIKKMAVMLLVIKTCVNIKEDFTQESIQRALELAKKYNLDKFEESVQECIDQEV